VVVAFRDEEAALGTLLRCLSGQRGVNYEVVLVDDGSRDGSVSIVEHFIHSRLPGQPAFRLVSNGGEGKKRALMTGIRAASGNVIVTTDADCTMGERWLKGLVATFMDARVQLAAGPVRMLQEGRFFEDLQAVEFASLIGVSGATMAVGRPTMCNGANLAFRKTAFVAVNGYAGNLGIASGDDEFLMRKVFARYPRGLRYVANPAAVVTTQAASTLAAFFRQRVRWASKWRYNSSGFTRAVAVYIFLLQIAWIAAFYLLVVRGGAVWPVALGLRAVLECFFLMPVCSAVGIRWRWFAFLVLQILYPLYVIAVALASFFYKPRWKENDRQPVS
jgi:cellulose synthase/poly-beta-1,6-N-acetylglucosamine synthase-like glycosyltransferase